MEKEKEKPKAKEKKKENKTSKITLSRTDYEFQSKIIKVQTVQLYSDIKSDLSLENKEKARTLLIKLLKEEIELLEKLEL